MGRQISEADRARALELIRELRDPDIAKEDEDITPRLTELERLVSCPHVSDLMFWHKPELTDEEVLERALEYMPFAL